MATSPARTPELSDIFELWADRDRRGEARAKAIAWCQANPDKIAHLRAFDIPELVTLVSHYRQAGDEEKRQLVDAYLLYAHEPQQIGGALRPGFNGDANSSLSEV